MIILHMITCLHQTQSTSSGCCSQGLGHDAKTQTSLCLFKHCIDLEIAQNKTHCMKTFNCEFGHCTSHMLSFTCYKRNRSKKETHIVKETKIHQETIQVCPSFGVDKPSLLSCGVRHFEEQQNKECVLFLISYQCTNFLHNKSCYAKLQFEFLSIL